MPEFNTDTILGTGLLIPFRRVGRDFVSGSGIETIKSSIRQILTTEKGELPWNPDFGTNLARMRHSNITETFMAEAEADILLALSTYEPRAEVISVIPRQDTNNRSAVIIEVKWRAIAQSRTRSTVLTETETTEVRI